MMLIIAFIIYNNLNVLYLSGYEMNEFHFANVQKYIQY